MREQQHLVRTWSGYLLGILTESAYVVVLVGVAGLVAWVVTLK